ncbi:hypothetical protein [Niabella ginsenosidivorans]|nr:hypothetical protein [Niabella ginsenosidivorans]
MEAQNMHLEKLQQSIHAAVHYLAGHQLPNGEFMTYIAPDDKMRQWCVPDSNTFIPALIGNCLMPLEASFPPITAMLDKTVAFLQYQMMRGGVWHFFPAWHPQFKRLPPDTDDTVTIAALLRKRKKLIFDNTPMLLANRTRNGLFYTWYTLHPTFIKFPRTYWRLILRELKHPLSTLLYWIKGDHKRNDVDAIVNANAIYYLGYNKTTEPVVRYLAAIIQNNKEAGSDKWYLNPLAYFYFISRLYTIPGVPSILTNIKPLIIKKIINAIHNSAAFADCDLEMALALSALVNMDYKDPGYLAGLAAQLMEKQQTAGNWERYILGTHPKKIIGWGSEEATTALAAEALYHYQLSLQNTMRENHEAV